jgi:hypothetical protein
MPNDPLPEGIRKMLCAVYGIDPVDKTMTPSPRQHRATLLSLRDAAAASIVLWLVIVAVIGLLALAGCQSTAQQQLNRAEVALTGVTRAMIQLDDAGKLTLEQKQQFRTARKTVYAVILQTRSDIDLGLPYDHDAVMRAIRAALIELAQLQTEASNDPLAPDHR